MKRRSSQQTDAFDPGDALTREIANAYTVAKLGGQCTYPSCDADALPDHCLCTEHRDDHRRRNRLHMIRARARLRGGAGE